MMIKRPDREPDFSFICFDWDGNDERTVIYWVDENIREIINHQSIGQVSEISDKIDVKYLYKISKELLDTFGDSVDRDYKVFVEAYEQYLVEKELLG